MDKKGFICTSDEDTRKQLIKEGLIEVNSSNGNYTFIVPDNLKFTMEGKNCYYSSRICI